MRVTSAKLVELGVYVLLVLLPLQIRYILVPSDNQFAIVSVYAFDIFIVLLGCLWLWYWYTHPSLKPHWHTVWLGLVIIILAIFSSYFADDQTVALYYWVHLVLGVGLVAMVATTPLRQPIVLGMMAVNGLVQASAALIQFTTQHVAASAWLGMAAQAPETSGVAVVVTSTGRWLRSYALMPHPNVAAGLMVLGLIALMLLKKNNWWLPLIGVLTFGLFLTFSRSAIIVWCLMLIVLTIMKKVSLSQVLTTVAILAVSIAVYWPLVSSRALNDQYIEQLSITERQDQLQNFQDLLPRYWPQGIGLGQFALDYDQPIHNVPLLIISELGIFAVIILYWFVFRSVTLSHPSSYLLLAIFLLGLLDHYWWTLPSMLLLWMFVTGWSFQHLPPAHKYHNINQK